MITEPQCLTSVPSVWVVTQRKYISGHMGLHRSPVLMLQTAVHIIIRANTGPCYSSTINNSPWLTMGFGEQIHIDTTSLRTYWLSVSPQHLLLFTTVHFCIRFKKVSIQPVQETDLLPLHFIKQWNIYQASACAF